MKLRTKFQDEDFELGEVVEANIYYGGGGRVKVIAESTRGGIITCYFETLKGMNEMFEDYEEPKGYWYYDTTNNGIDKINHLEDKEKDQEIGNYFETEEEAEKAVEKLKAWKRLKDKGFKFTDWYRDVCEVSIQAEIYDEGILGMINDLDLLFGGKE